jgi:hypothetical protein
MSKVWLKKQTRIDTVFIGRLELAFMVVSIVILVIGSVGFFRCFKARVVCEHSAAQIKMAAKKIDVAQRQIEHDERASESSNFCV